MRPFQLNTGQVLSFLNMGRFRFSRDGVCVYACARVCVLVCIRQHDQPVFATLKLHCYTAALLLRGGGLVLLLLRSSLCEPSAVNTTFHSLKDLLCPTSSFSMRSPPMLPYPPPVVFSLSSCWDRSSAYGAGRPSRLPPDFLFQRGWTRRPRRPAADPPSS